MITHCPLPVVIVFKVHFPGGKPLLQLPNDLQTESLITLDGNEGVAIQLVASAGVISLDDSEWSICYLTSCTSARGCMISVSCCSVISRGSWPI
jgi:hypothetical protein